MDNSNINLQNNGLKLDILADNFSLLIHSNISILEKQKKILLQYVLKISDFPSTNLSINSSNELIEFLSNLKKKLVLVDENISKASDYLNKIKNLDTTENLNILFNEYINISSEQSKCIIDIEDFLIDSIIYTSLNFDIQIPLEDTSSADSIIDEQPPISNNSKEKKKQDFDNQDTNLIENTLVISETQGKVFLPYTIDTLKSILEEENTKYKNINEVIEGEFVIPFTNFKNPILSRFKEAFKLIRYKEHGSIKDAFDLGMELLLNYNLHPAIISACKNIDELDIYLDCLENNETDKFDCFNIKFEIPLQRTTKKN